MARSQRSKWVIITTIVCFFSLVYAGNCLSAEKVFKLGISAPLTGPVAKSGAEQKSSATMALEAIGGKIGEYKIELVFIDDQGDPSKATNAYAEAIERLGVQAIVLAWNTSVSTAVQDILARYKVPYFFALGAGKTTVDKWASLPPEKRYLINKGWPIPVKLALGYSDFLNGAIEKGIWKPEKKLLAVGAEDTDWGRGISGQFKEFMTKKGWNAFTEEYFALTQTDFYPFLNKCKQAGVSVLFVCSTAPASAAALAKQSREIGLKAVYIADGLGWLGDWYKLTGAASDGAFDMQPQLSTPSQKAWAEKFRNKFGYPPSASCAGISYDGVSFFFKVAKRTLEKYGKIDSDSLFRIGNEEVNTGKLDYTAEDGAIIQKRYRWTAETAPDPVVSESDFYFPVIQYMKGKGSVVFPDSMKETEAVFK